MSIWFVSTSGTDLWNPSSRAAEFFLRGIRSTEVFIEQESGVGDVREDEVAVDPDALSHFFNVAQEKLSHPIMQTQAMGLMALIAVLLSRCDLSPLLSPTWAHLEPAAEAVAVSMPR